MKTVAISCIFLMLVLPRLEAVNPANYQRLWEINNKAKRVIGQLEDIEIHDVSFEKLSAAEAMAYLTKKVVGEKGGGVINFVIRGADEAKKVGITRESLTFAHAVDEICRQSGKVWAIHFSKTSGAPILVIEDIPKFNDPQYGLGQPGAGQPATAPESKPEGYTQAFALLEEARQKSLPANWTKILDLIRSRPDQPPLEKRSRLVRTAHDVLTASCSERGLQHILGRDLSDEGALILKVRRYRGSFSEPVDLSLGWGFDGVGTKLRMVYPPQNPGLRVGILDWSLERLLLHFLLSGAPDAPTAYGGFSLAMSGRDWSIVEFWSFKKAPIPEDTKDRLRYLSSTSELLEHLLGGEVPECVTFLDVKEIVIEDDTWKAARLDYRLDNEEYVLPLFIIDGAWLPNRPWTGRSYRDLGIYIGTRNYFRPYEDVEKHNAKQGTERPATTGELK